MTTITLSADLPRGTYTLVPVPSTAAPPAPPALPASAVPPARPAQPAPPAQTAPAALFATSFSPPASIASLVGDMRYIYGIPAPPWGSPPLAIQCLGPASEHQHSIVPVASTGGAALHLRMLAGSGDDQAALLVQPRQAISSFYFRERLILDAKLGSILKPDGANNSTMIAEWKNGGQGAQYGGDFRFKLELQMDNGGALRWRVGADNNANRPDITTVTSYMDTEWLPTPAPKIGQWIMLTGTMTPTSCAWSIDGVALPSYTGKQGTMPVNRIMLVNLYGGYPQERYITDIELRSAPP